jgi:hypothetical protein
LTFLVFAPWSFRIGRCRTLTASIKVLILGTFNSSIFFLKIEEDKSLKKLGEYTFSEHYLDKKSSIPNCFTIQVTNGEFKLLVGLRDGTLIYMRLDMNLIVKGPNFLSLCISILQSTSLGSKPVYIINSGLANSAVAFSDKSAWVTLKDDTFEVKNIILKQVIFMMYN